MIPEETGTPRRPESSGKHLQGRSGTAEYFQLGLQRPRREGVAYAECGVTFAISRLRKDTN